MRRVGHSFSGGREDQEPFLALG